MKKFYFLMVAVALSMLVFSCKTAMKNDGKLSIVVTIPPQKYFVERVGGEHVRVEVLVKPGQSPHTYEPTFKQIASLSEADAFFIIGMPFESMIADKAKQQNKNLDLVDMRKGIDLRRIESSEIDADHGGPQGSLDPHIWMNPRNVKIMAGTICDELSAKDPEHKSEYEKNLAAFRVDLDSADARISKLLAPLKGESVLVYHPAFGYFTDAYGLRQIAVEVGGKEPTAKQRIWLSGMAKQAGARVVFVQPQFSRKSADEIASEIGGAVVPIDDLAENYIESIARAMDNGLRK